MASGDHCTNHNGRLLINRYAGVYTLYMYTHTWLHTQQCNTCTYTAYIAVVNIRALVQVHQEEIGACSTMIIIVAMYVKLETVRDACKLSLVSAIVHVCTELALLSCPFVYIEKELENARDGSVVL